ncbi:MAG TPA: type IX secretion system outer membrane channel protein PorV [Bacteroidota bacterium]|nr:type IX secretion system outer membrane channel protein PorV [Bacteroidota bacterium]
MRRSTMLLFAISAAGIFRTLPAQVTTTAVPFLMIAPDSRASGMGEAGVALADDAWATYWNPAGYAFQSGSEASINYSDWQPALDLGDVWIANMVYKQDVRQLDGTVSAAFTYLNQGEIGRTLNDATVLETFKSYELAFVLGYSTKLSNVLGIGFNLRIIHSAISPFGSPDGQGNGIATGGSFDVGMLYHPQSLVIPLVNHNLGDRLSLGFNLSNIGPKLTYGDASLADPIPMNLRLGLALKLFKNQYNDATFIADFNKLLVNDTDSGSDVFYKAFFTSWTGRTIGEEFRQFDTGLGFEYWYGAPKLFAFRTGYFYEDPAYGNRKFFTFGVGVRVESYEFDFSYIAASEKDDPVGGTLRFTLLASFGGLSKSDRALP